MHGAITGKPADEDTVLQKLQTQNCLCGALEGNLKKAWTDQDGTGSLTQP